ncbi:phosphatases II [Gonapodya prolifera JEL478]|uniref:Phosphatases II n=1 Tax=Gonapodya prolifera (strain JEL478) TaxID=1344416 RepID=A0A139ADF5_GONPJ|nr:phosphatases II [Gonapodya prolifera JEL478]|eukprot:KXS14475.1 phosphatases II [Gonapodya prolifera JEL478]
MVGLSFLTGTRWWNRITPNIILGAIPARPLLQDLISNQMVFAVLSVIEPNRLYITSSEEYAKLGVRWLNLDADDFADLSYDVLVAGVEWIEQALKEEYIRVGDSLASAVRRTVSMTSIETGKIHTRRFTDSVLEISSGTPGKELTSFPDPIRYTSTPGASVFGKSVYVHCKAGRSRSAAVVLAHLISRYRLTLEEALAILIRKRPQVSPHIQAMPSVRRFYEDILGKETRCEIMRYPWFDQV